MHLFGKKEDGVQTQEQDKKSKEFVWLLTTYQSNIYAYIVSLVANFNDADDIIQETTSLMWEQFDQFKPGTDFVAWGIRIAYFKVLDFRKKKRADQKIFFSDDVFRKFAENAPAHLEDSGDIIQRLQDCVKKLQAPDSSLVHLRYLTGLSVLDISRRFNASIRSIYYNLSRIQGMLLNCIQRDEI